MDDTTAEILAQVTSKLLHEEVKYHRIIKEVSVELQSLTTALYHVNRDAMNLTRHSARLHQSRKLIEDEMLTAFRASTKYTRLFNQLEDIMQQFYVAFMDNRHQGLSSNGLPKLKIDFSDVRFKTKGKYT